MLQASMGDMLLQLTGGDVTDTFSELYYEPGFNIMSPLEFEFPRCDRLSLKLKKRANEDGSSFSNINSTDMSLTVIDPTNGRSIPYTLSDEEDDQLLLTIINALTLNDPVVRARSIDVYIKDTTDDDFIIFRILVNDQHKYFHYIFISSNRMTDRNFLSAQGRDIYVTVNASSNYYLLFSPYAYLKESTSSEANFSYPLNTIFYKRQDSYNNEDYSFSMSSYSHTFVNNTVSIMNVPSYSKVGVLLVDNKLYKDIIEMGVNPYVEIAVVGEISGISDIFKVNFKT